MIILIYCRGHVTVLGAILIQLAVGAHHGTFGNLLPYFTSFMRQVLATFYNLFIFILSEIMNSHIHWLLLERS
jgi:hypothetical protein